MATRVGYHFMSSGIDNWQLALEDAIASNASGHLVLDNLPFADKLARTISSKVTIVHRQTTLSNDETLRLSPAQAIDYINHPYPVVHQLLNEPGGFDQGQLEWMVAVLKSAPKGLRIGLPAYGTGNPHENDILGGRFDPLIRALGGTDHCLILHEYSQSHNGKNFVPPVPYWVARWTFWQTRARAIGAGNLRFIISEAGRDVGGAMGGAGDGWLNARHPDGSRWTDVDYLRLIKLQAAQYPPTIPLILYCYGRGWSTPQYPEGDWASFDISRASWLLKELSNYNLTVPLTETPMLTIPVRLPAGTPTFQATIAAPGGPINIRNAPSTGASAVGSVLASGRVLTFADVTQYPDWYWVDAGTFSGWINKLKGYPTPLALKEVMVIPTPAPVEGVTLLVSELEDLSYHFSEIAGVFRGAAGRG